MEKCCSKCGETKPIEDFNKNRRRPDGYAHWCRQCANKANSMYKKANRPKITQAQREWRAANPDKVAAYYEANKEMLNQRSRDHYAANKQQYKENYLKWVKENKEKWTAYRNQWSRKYGSGHHARARRFGVPYTRFSKHQVYERDGWICQLCGDPVDKSIQWPDPLCASLDHIIPLSLGPGICPGHTESNAQLAHFACNLVKRDTYGEADDETTVA